MLVREHPVAARWQLARREGCVPPYSNITYIVRMGEGYSLGLMTLRSRTMFACRSLRRIEICANTRAHVLEIKWLEKTTPATSAGSKIVCARHLAKNAKRICL